MYVPAHFAAEDADVLIARLSRKHAAILVTADDGGDLVATHMPMLWDANARVASGHIARANPQHRFEATRGLLILSGPEAYVSPNLYPSKAEHGKAVPTWNYEAVHFTGPIEWFDDAARLRGVVRDLSARHEADRAKPWSIDEAPEAYTQAMLRGIVGVAMRVEKVEAKRKLSQNKDAADFAGVRDGLADESPEIAALMRDLNP